MYNRDMDYFFRWSDRKASANLTKHKVNFEEAKSIFYDPFILTAPDEFHSEKEERLISIGTSVSGKLLTVIHLEKEQTERGYLIRIISCRKATLQERRRYEEGE